MIDAWQEFAKTLIYERSNVEYRLETSLLLIYFY